MELMPYFVGFAAVCFVLSFGLRSRAAWMWYAGWVLLYLFAGYVGTFFFSTLYYAGTPGAAAAALLYLLAGLVLWLPAAVWWAGHRHLFGPRRKGAVASSANNAPQSPNR